ncbi:MAG: hypothetical protein V4532_04230 [Pseudomonadota bacterium]
MLRSLVLVLLLVNVGFYTWSQGWLDDVVGVPVDAQHEPQRLSQQVRADQLIVLSGASSTAAPASAMSPSLSASAASSQASPPSAALSASAPTSSPLLPTTAEAAITGRTLCVEAGPFSAPEHAQVEASLKPLLPPTQRWVTDSVTVQGLWMVYMGPYPDPELMARKQVELRRIRGLSFEEVRSPAALAQGLSLGRYGRQDEADAAISSLKSRGIRTARIVTLRPSMELQVIRVPQADSKTQVVLSSLKLPQGKEFTACRQ